MLRILLSAPTCGGSASPEASPRVRRRERSARRSPRSAGSSWAGTAIREIDVLDLLTLYGVDAREREQLPRAGRARSKSGPAGGTRYNDILPDWFQAYVGMEGGGAVDPGIRGSVHPRAAADGEEYATAVDLLGDCSPLSRPSGSSCCGRNGSAGFGVASSSSGSSSTRRCCAVRSPGPTCSSRAAALPARGVREPGHSPCRSSRTAGAAATRRRPGFSILRFVEELGPASTWCTSRT